MAISVLTIICTQLHLAYMKQYFSTIIYLNANASLFLSLKESWFANSPYLKCCLIFEAFLFKQ